MSQSWEIYAEDVEREPDYEIPNIWTPEHVMHRLVEACKVIKRMPNERLRGLAAVWPQHTYEHGDFVAWEDLTEMEKQDRHADVNRTRNLPGPHEITLMEEAVGWPGKYLKGEPGVIIVRWAGRRAQSRHATQQSEPATIVVRQAMLIAAGLRKDVVAVR